MSVGVRRISTTPISTMSIARTTNVYGRRSASWTIHMAAVPFATRVPRGLRGEWPRFAREFGYGCGFGTRPGAETALPRGRALGTRATRGKGDGRALAVDPRMRSVRKVALVASLTMLAPGLARAEGARVLTLAEVERAAQRQPQMLVARAATNIAQGQADQARAPLLPQITATAQYTRETGNYATNTTQKSQGLGGGTSLTTSFDYWQFDVGATQLIYDFGQAS